MSKAVASYIHVHVDGSYFFFVLYFIILLGHSQQTLRSSYRVPKMNEMSYAVQLACTVCKTSEKNDKCMQLSAVHMHPAGQVPHLPVQLPDSSFCKPHATGYDEAFCTHFNQSVHKIMHRYADREVWLCCMHNICCTSVTSDFLPDGEGSG